MLFDSSLRKELARSFGATLVVLVTVVMTMMLIRTLGQASKGNVNPSDVMLVMGYTVLGNLSTILGLSLFIAVVGVLSRMYRESEMVIWFASGRGLASLIKPLLKFAWPVIALIAVLSLAVWPWSNQQVQQLRAQYEQRGDLDRIAPGEFQESSNGQRVFFIDKETPSNSEGSNVFVADASRGKDIMTSARKARIETVDGDRVLLLSDGQRLENTPDQKTVKVSDFVEYGTIISSNASSELNDINVKNTPTLQLLANPDLSSEAEIGWRVGMALGGFNFVLLGLAMVSVNPRAGRSGGLVLALLAFVIYYNLMTVGQSWVEAGRLGLFSYMFGLHGGTLVLALAILAARHHQWSPARLWQGRSAS